MLKRVIRLAVISLGAVSCHTWTHVQTPEDAILRAGTGTVQVTKADSSIVLVQSPRMIQDTLIGTSVDRAHSRVAIPMREVSGIATQEVSLWRTAGAGYLTILGGLFLALLTISIMILAVN